MGVFWCEKDFYFVFKLAIPKVFRIRAWKTHFSTHNIIVIYLATAKLAEGS